MASTGQFERFLELMKKIHVNISLVELLTNIPKYAKFINELISNKEKLSEEVVPLSEKCSCIIRKHIFIPQKLRDPGSCTISCNIEASISLRH